MDKIFEVTDKTGRKIRLTDKQWNHIKSEHPDISEEEIKSTITDPVKIIDKGYEKHFYYQYLKYKKSPFNFLRVIVKYLNNHGFIITAYLVKKIS